jgi:hypothetical protein
MQAILQREYLQNDSYKRKFALLKMCLKMNLKILFYEVLFHDSKELIENPNFILYYANKTYLSK